MSSAAARSMRRGDLADLTAESAATLVYMTPSPAELRDAVWNTGHFGSMQSFSSDWGAEDSC